MTERVKTATLATIFSEVLANLAFMFTDEEQPEVTTGDLWLETTISYSGSINGSLKLFCTRDFAVLLAANLLGTDLEDEEAQSDAIDAVKEFMNIVCGQLVTAYHGTEKVFNLTIPEVRELPAAPDLSAAEGDDSTMVCVDGHRVQLSYTKQE